LKNIGDPSSMNMAKATARKIGENIMRTIRANIRLSIVRKRLKSSH
jgi:hypothetical protein